MRRIALAGVTLALTAGTAAAAMTNDMDLVYGKYQMAIRAAQLCRGAPDSDAAWRAWSSHLDAKTNHELGAGERLSIIEGAKVDVTYMDLVYGKYQMAIRAAQLCRGVPDSDAAWRQWSGYLDAKTHHELGAGERLTIIEGAKADVTYMVRRQGCDSAAIKDLLALYDAELAGLLQR